MLEILFWLFAVLGATPYLIYPLGLAAVSALVRGRGIHTRLPPGFSPRVSVLIAARNEEEVLARRLDNLLAQDYPGDIEILVGSDRSEDDTDRIASSYADRGVILHRSDMRQGKPGILRRLVELCSGEILVFTDADTLFAPDTVSRLVAPFADPDVGCVDGSRRNSLERESCESTYWRYERAVKRLCSRLGAVLGATGAVFALRRSLYEPLAPGRADDFELAVMPRIRGYRCVYSDRAVAAEPTPDDGSQFRRMVRIVSWMSVSGIMLAARALRAGRPGLALQLLLHKMLRWVSGFMLLAVTVLSGLLWSLPLYRIIFLLLLAFHALAVLGSVLRDRMPSKLSFPYYFWLMNLASMTGLLRLIAGNPIETWERRRRPSGRDRAKEN
jgi:cellulose synthase/poly-beta-1,6-N-acetylglucosamine synthase-like glycosyltransferase